MKHSPGQKELKIVINGRLDIWDYFSIFRTYRLDKRSAHFVKSIEDDKLSQVTTNLKYLTGVEKKI